MRRTTSITALMASLLIMASLAGCWDALPVTDRATTLVLAVDWNPRRSHIPRWTFYFPNPAVTVDNLTDLAPSEQLYDVSVSAPTLAAAYNDATRRLARSLYFGQLNLVLWSSNMPTAEVSRFVEGYTREGMTVGSAFAAVAPAGALDELMKPSPQVTIPEIYWVQLFRCTKCQAESLTTHMWETWDDFQMGGVSPVVPYETPTRSVGRIAVYRAAGAPVIFTLEQTLGWAYLTNRVSHEVVTVSMDGVPVTVTRVAAHATTRVQGASGRLWVTVRLEAHGELAQGDGHRPISAQWLDTARTLVARRILALAMAAIRRADETHTDPFGFGRMYLLHAGYRAGMAPPPPDVVLPMTARVTVTMHLTGIGKLS